VRSFCLVILFAIFIIIGEIRIAAGKAIGKLREKICNHVTKKSGLIPKFTKATKKMK